MKNIYISVLALLIAFAAAHDLSYGNDYQYFGKVLRGFQSGFLGQKVEGCMLSTDEAAKRDFAAIVAVVRSWDPDSTVGDMKKLYKEQIAPFIATHTLSQCKVGSSLYLVSQHCHNNDNCLPHYLVGNVAANAAQLAKAIKEYKTDAEQQLRSYDLGVAAASITFLTYPPTLQGEETTEIAELVYQ